MADWTVDKKDVTSTVDGDFMLYKNRPIVREDNVICYGNISDKYVVQMIIMSETEYKGKKVPDKIYIQLICTEPDENGKKKVVKEAMRTGMFEALDYGNAWLDSYVKH